MNHDPKFTIFTGPMFGSKTTKMLATIDRYRYQQKKVVAFKPTIDERYDKSSIVTHSGGKIPAICVKSGSDILDYIQELDENPDVIAVDEAFMIKESSTALISLFKAGYTIVVSSLQLSATGNSFEEVRDMMPWATKIEVCPAVCPATGRDAYYTHKKDDNLAEIAVGGSDLYEPRCWEMHRYINRKEF
jgi:thymidine kinase